ncbi:MULTISPECIES: sugar MFS transporter [Hymenobacter]|uniref:Sugar MFS transporter n=2 Tax=Hymenobacter TaxID=89966 RepID=A0ABS6WYC0_9BACT|nr:MULTISPECIES: sugar MFS transporter [Hymenobacter]MBO3270665.1 sugar MFS transporter [Hymenobacter defluvii]MBW3128600.1 sugar MFS transporter [Hymenobacter profundi]QNE40034.1 sugar MFS transporter [Hymenobacter sp. NBH84]
MTKAATTSPATVPTANTQQTRSIVIIGALFFIFGFVTWLNSVLVPYLRIACELSNFQAYLVTSAFYISYLVMAIPSAWVLEATGFKKGMSVGLLVMAVGALVFIPAAYTRTYGLFLLGLFILGSGLALLQTASNPYITILGPRESAAKRISVMGICNKVAGALAPVALGAVVLKDADSLVARLKTMNLATKAAELDALAARVVTPYLLITAVLVLLAVLIYFSSLPEIDTDHEDETVAAANTNKTSVLQFPHLLLGALAMFFYVGVEVIAGDTIISYGNAQGIALETAKFFTTFTMGAMIVGYLIGIVAIPKFISQEKALQLFAVIGVAFALGALSTSGITSVLFIALLGLANSLIFPAIWPLAIAGLGRFTKIGSSFLIMAIAGGAVLPPLYGGLADAFSPQQAYWLVIPCYLFILYYGLAGHKVRR